MDPLAQYHDKLNATVVEALREATSAVADLRKDMQTIGERQATTNRIVMDTTQRLIALEKSRLAGVVALSVQAFVGFLLCVAIVFVGVALWRIAELVELLAR